MKSIRLTLNLSEDCIKTWREQYREYVKENGATHTFHGWLASRFEEALEMDAADIRNSEKGGQS